MESQSWEKRQLYHGRLEPKMQRFVSDQSGVRLLGSTNRRPKGNGARKATGLKEYAARDSGRLLWCRVFAVSPALRALRKCESTNPEQLVAATRNAEGRSRQRVDSAPAVTLRIGY